VTDSGPRHRLLGVDLGERRIGVAVGDTATGAATPLTTLGRGRTAAHDARVLARLATERGVGAVIVGLPLNDDGSEGPQAAATRDWASAVTAESGLTLRFHDERLTSQRAERLVGAPARGRSGGPPGPARREAHRARIDREAAALILQDYLDSLAAAERPAAGDAEATE
jgi:putative Holliday junction resolvase